MTNDDECQHVWVTERILGAQSGDQICVRCHDVRPRPPRS
jgi:hypothetical protein